jgi:hypothetical protein
MKRYLIELWGGNEAPGPRRTAFGSRFGGRQVT